MLDVEGLTRRTQSLTEHPLWDVGDSKLRLHVYILGVILSMCTVQIHAGIWLHIEDTLTHRNWYPSPLSSSFIPHYTAVIYFEFRGQVIGPQWYLWPDLADEKWFKIVLTYHYIYDMAYNNSHHPPFFFTRPLPCTHLFPQPWSDLTPIQSILTEGLSLVRFRTLFFLSVSFDFTIHSVL